MRTLRIYLFAFAALGTVATEASSQDRRAVIGAVVDTAGRPIPYVTIDGGQQMRTLSNAAGEWRLLAPRTALQLEIRRIGYSPAKIALTPGSDTGVRITLEQLGVLLSSQVVRAQQLVRGLETRGFYSRMLDAERGALVGEFILPEEIEMRNPQRVTQLLEQRRGIQIRRMGSCQIIVTCYRVYGTGGCAATVFLDGQRLNRLETAARDPSGAVAIDELIPVTGVSGIEIYPRGSSAPPRYQSLAGTCGVVVIWTK